MQTLTQNELKDNVLKVLELVENGEEILIRKGDNKKNIAVLIPYLQYKQKKERRLGILKGKASYKIRDDFKITDEEFLSL